MTFLDGCPSLQRLDLRALAFTTGEGPQRASCGPRVSYYPSRCVMLLHSLYISRLMDISFSSVPSVY